MWCVPHPQKPDHTLVLLDTEGLGDVEKVRKEGSIWMGLISSWLEILVKQGFPYSPSVQLIFSIDLCVLCFIKIKKEVVCLVEVR